MARDDDSSGSSGFDLLRSFGLGNAAGLGPGAAVLARPTSPLDRIPETSASGGPMPVQNLDIPAQGRALLATIGGPGFESNGTYSERFGAPDFNDFSQHPATRSTITSGPNKGNWSDAAGRYMMISTTYGKQAQKLGLTDFSPKSQDTAAWNLAKETYADKYKGRDLAQDLQNPAYLPKIVSALRTQWSSLPGGVEQSSAGMKGFAKAFGANLKGEFGRSASPPSLSPVDRLVQNRQDMARGGATG